jgi:intracellular sulfur oxidation DsrE/DsrF family protein
MNRTLPAALLAAALGLLPAAAGAQSPAKAATLGSARHHLVIQVSDNDPAKWNLALNNARNVQEDLGMDNVEIEVVAYGPGLPMVKMDSPVAQRIASATAQGVTVIACENTMKNTKVERSQILPGVKFYGAGVVHLMQRQKEGWAYVRP